MDWHIIANAFAVCLLHIIHPGADRASSAAYDSQWQVCAQIVRVYDKHIDAENVQRVAAQDAQDMAVVDAAAAEIVHAGGKP